MCGLDVAVHLDGHVGADAAADGTARALGLVNEDGVVVALGVETLGHSHDLLRTVQNAVLAALASLVVYLDRPLCHSAFSFSLKVIRPRPLLSPKQGRRSRPKRWRNYSTIIGTC